jgi:hypothetical protein
MPTTLEGRSLYHITLTLVLTLTLTLTLTTLKAEPIYHLATIDVKENAVVAAPEMQLVKGPPNVKVLFVLQLALAQ